MMASPATRARARLERGMRRAMRLLTWEPTQAASLPGDGAEGVVGEVEVWSAEEAAAVDGAVGRSPPGAGWVRRAGTSTRERRAERASTRVTVRASSH